MESKSTAEEAAEHLLLIRQTIERSQRHSTLSGLSGIAAGVIVIGSSVFTETYVGDLSQPGRQTAFVILWFTTLILAAVSDFVITKLRAKNVGKTLMSGIGSSWLRAVMPGLIMGLIVSILYIQDPETYGGKIYGLWMLSYAMSILAIGQLSVRSVSVLGWCFLGISAFTLIGPVGWLGPRGLLAISFGGFHIVYGLIRGLRDGW